MREAQECVDTVARILSNYLAALELAGSPRRDVLEPVRDACSAVPGLAELVEEAMAATSREQIAATHSRLLRRRPALTRAARGRAAAARLRELETGTHSACALFTTLSR